MTTPINPAFRPFSYANLNDPAAFIKAMQAAKPSLNTEVAKLTGEGSTDQLSFFNLQAAARFSENVYVAQMANADRTTFSTAQNVQALVIGGTGDDFITAGDMDDMLIGGKGDDTLYGGKGADLFVVGQGSDKIGDFTLSDSVTITYPAGQKPTIAWKNEGVGYWDSSLDPDQVKFKATLSNGNSFTLQMTVKDIAAALGKTEAEVRAMKPETLMAAMQSKLEARIGFEELKAAGVPANPPAQDDRDTARGGTDADKNQDIWGKTTGGKLNAGKGDDILHALGGTTTMTGGAGADHFHVTLGQGSNIITDFNFQQQDRIIINGLKAKFDKDKVEVTSVGNNFIVKYDGVEIAKLEKYPGMPMSDAIDRIKAAVRGGQQADGAYDNVFRGAEENGMTKTNQVFRLAANQTTLVTGFDPAAGQDISFPGLTPREVKNRVVGYYDSKTHEYTLKLDNKLLATFTPPAIVGDFSKWKARVDEVVAKYLGA